MNQSLKHSWQWLVMLLGMLAPILVILIFPTTYYRDDLGDFWNWSQFLKEDIRDIYIRCAMCTYPLLGTIFSAGVMSQLGFAEFSQIIIPFRLYLALFDAANVFLIYKILKKLEIDNAPLWAGLIGILPSSWMGSSVWGQIEGLSQLLILSTFFFVISFNLKKENTNFSNTIFLVIVGGMLSLMILTKQLLLFSFASLTFIIVINILLFSKNLFVILRSLIIFLLAFLLPVFIIDSLLILKTKYFSHLQFILTKGSTLADIISGNGFNIWTFFAESPIQSSHVPLTFQITLLPTISVTPYSAGIVLFIFFNLIVASLYIKYFYKKYFMQSRQFFNREDLLILILHIALVNLSFNLFLTGSHERYLYHFYPFVIIAALGLFNRNFVYFLFGGGTCYAIFVLTHIRGLLSLYGQAPFFIMFTIHFPLYFYLIFLLRRKLNTANDFIS